MTLAVIPSVDAVLNQVNSALHLSIGPLSVLQAVRGILLLWMAGTCLWALCHDTDALSRVPIPAIAALFLIGIVVSKEFIETGSIATEGAIAYGQLAYWVLLWTTAALLCKEHEQSTLLLRGLAVGAVVTAISVFLGYVIGGVNYYESDDVRASAGWFNTAKMISGILVCGCVVILFLGRRTKSWLAAALAILCSIACILTYARAGTVALGAVTVWLALWWATHLRRPWVSVKIFLGALAVTVAVALAVIPSQTLFARWADVSDGDHAGSGRAAIWQVAWDSVTHGSTTQQALGSGYYNMSETLLQGYGDDVKHTHNDMLDMLMVGGLVGAAWLILLIGNWGIQIARMRLWSYEGAAAAAIFLGYLCHAQLTGQLWGTDAMTYYVLALTSFAVLARHPVVELVEERPMLVRFART